jgi:hypothetical protein
MPRKGRIPRPGHTVTVVVGEPVPLDDLTCGCTRDSEAVWLAITERVGGALRGLEARVPPNPSQVGGEVRETEVGSV